MSQYDNFKLAYEAFNDKEFREQHAYWQRQVAHKSIALFEYAQTKRPISIILANHTYFWFNSIKQYSTFYKEYDRRFDKMYLEAYKLCKEIGIEQFNEIVKNEKLNVQILEGEGDITIEEWIEHYEKELE